MWEPSFRNSRLILTIAIVLALVAAGWALRGSLGVFAALLLGLLVAALRHDNDLGTCFPLALLFVLLVVILALLTAAVILVLAQH